MNKTFSKLSFILFLLLTFNQSIIAQQKPLNQFEYFCKAIGTSNTDDSYSILKLSDGYIIGGISINSPLCMKVDLSGNLVWSKKFTCSNGFPAQSTVRTTDGNFVLSGGAAAGTSAIKFDSLGNIIWSKSLSNMSNIRSSCGTNDGGVAFVGGQMEVTKLDLMGNFQWNKTILGASTPSVPVSIAQGNSIQQTTDGGYILAGTTYGSAPDLFVVKLDNLLNITWAKTIDAGGNDEGNKIIATSDGGYVVVGSKLSGSFNRSMYIVKLNNLGNVQWSRTVHQSSNMYESAWSVIENSKKDLIVCGATSGGSTSNAFVVSLTSTGTLNWASKMGGSGNSECLLDIVITPDNGYLMCGYTTAYGSGSDDVFLVKIDSLGVPCSTCNYNSGGSTSSYHVVSSGGYITSGTITVTPNTPTIVNVGTLVDVCTEIKIGIKENYKDAVITKIYPNPNSGIFTIESDYNEEQTLHIIDLNGKVLFEQFFVGNTKVDLNFLPAGVYNCETISKKGNTNSRLVILK